MPAARSDSADSSHGSCAFAASEPVSKHGQFSKFLVGFSTKLARKLKPKSCASNRDFDGKNSQIWWFACTF
jgi:hypothetical protein